VKNAVARILGRKTDIMTPAQLAPRFAGAHRGPSAESWPVPCLTDITEVIELIRSDMGHVTPDAFDPDRRKRWLVERGAEIISESSRRLPHTLEASQTTSHSLGPWWPASAMCMNEHVAPGVQWRVLAQESARGK
jgi:hypothetical protein